MLPNKQRYVGHSWHLFYQHKDLRESQGFIEKVGEIRFTKVKQRQLSLTT